ncbi:MAG: hypothetical protein K2M91_04280 [Lachnospiraceae bacterium]|nr:hypothetical protein [Lachnospiraceae bacterium]
MVVALLPASQLYAKSEYKGTIVDGKKQGYGIEYNEDGSRMDGYWVNDVKQGFVKLYDEESWYKVFVHDGEETGPMVGCDDGEKALFIADNLKNGLGVGIDESGKVVSAGTVKDGEIKDSLTCWKLGDITYYVMDKEDIESGNAIAVYSNKNVYVGGFKNQKFDGKGVYYNANGTWYAGNWNGGVLEGDCYFHQPYSDSTELHDLYMRGTWKNDKLQGAYVTYRSDHSRFVCRAKDGKADGLGVTIKADGKKVFSEWKNGKLVKNNINTWTADDGASYIGEKKGKTIDGYGACIYKNGAVSVGNFVNGVHEGEAYIYWPDTDSYFDGQYKAGKYHGEGAVYYRNGNYFKGTYNNGEWDEGRYYYYGEGWFDGTFQSGKFDTGSYTKILEDKSTSIENYKNGQKVK